MNFNIERNAFEKPFKHRFTFVPEGVTYLEGTVIQVSEKITALNRAFYIACEEYIKRLGDNPVTSVAIFYGDVESPDCLDKLYKAYALFHTKSKGNKSAKPKKEKASKKKKSVLIRNIPV